MTDAHPRSTILLVEDDPAVRGFLAAELAADGYVTVAAGSVEEGRDLLESVYPDLALVDLCLPDGSGLDLLRSVRGEDGLASRVDPRTPVLVLSGRASEVDRLRGFDQGCDDYLAKPFSMAELLARARALLRRSGRLSSAARQVGDVVIDDGARTVVRNGNVLDLTRTEYDLLSVLAQHPGQVLSKVQLLTQVWGFDAYDANLVEVHMSSLRRKLEAHGPRLIQTVRGVGYVLRP